MFQEDRVADSDRLLRTVIRKNPTYAGKALHSVLAHMQLLAANAAVMSSAAVGVTTITAEDAPMCVMLALSQTKSAYQTVVASLLMSVFVLQKPMLH